jgi:hypothetical protein
MEGTIALLLARAPPGAPSQGMVVEIDRPLHSVLVVIGGHIGGALQELGVTIDRSAIDPSDVIRCIVQSVIGEARQSIKHRVALGRLGN